MSVLRRYLLGWLIWTALALLSASQTSVHLTLANRETDWAQIIPSQLISWYSCAVFTPLFFAAARRWPIDSRTWVRNVPVHLVICAVATVLRFWIAGIATTIVLRHDVPSLLLRVQRGFISENIAFWCMAAVIHAIVMQRRVVDREIRAATLEVELSRAQLTALSARLQPHFLFNTLQGISTLLYRDARAADVMLRHLSTLLRRTLEAPAQQEIPLERELSLAEEYFAIARARFGDRLTILTEVSPETLQAHVPQMLLQPLLENALDHGIAKRGGEGRVALRTMRDDSTLQIEVTNDGRTDVGDDAPDGIGLGATRARLERLYGHRASLDVRNEVSGTTTASVRIPWHLVPIAASGAGEGEGGR